MTALQPEKVRRDDLAGHIAHWTGALNRLDTAVPGLTLHRWTAPTEATSYVLPPSVCLIGQGRKLTVVGEESYVYDAQTYLITSVDLPVVARILEASEEVPYLGLSLELDLRTISHLILAHDVSAAPRGENRMGIAVSQVSTELLDCFCRLINLLAQPRDVPVLAPLIKQEIFYRLLTGEQGARLRQIASAGNAGFQVARSIDWLKENYNKPVRVEDLASKAGLSASAFHNHFRSTTSMSPLQYQKRLRLNEARRLMFAENIDASTAAYNVGYESASQFNREYSRLFGAPPKRDIKNLSSTTTNLVS